MSTTWAVVDAKLQRLLKTTDDNKYSASLRQDAFNAALRAFASHTAKQATQTITGDGSTTQWTLSGVPLETADWFEGVWDDDKQLWLEPVRFGPGAEWRDDTPPGFYIWPQLKINLTYILDTSKTAKIYYYTHWGEVSSGVDVVDTPTWALNALLYYSAAYSVAPDGIQAAQIRQYGTRVDSGNPDNNPVHEQAKFFLGQYDAELRRYTPQQRGMGFTPGRGI